MPKTVAQLLSLATKFRLTDDLSIEKRGEDSWAVTTRTGSCINTFFEREIEPSPSNRDDEFLARSRFTLQGAFAHAEAYLAQAPAWERVGYEPG